MSIYDFKVLNNKGEEVAISEYKGKEMLIINSDTDCGFISKYVELQKLFVSLHKVLNSFKN